MSLCWGKRVAACGLFVKRLLGDRETLWTVEPRTFLTLPARILASHQTSHRFGQRRQPYSVLPEDLLWWPASFLLTNGSIAPSVSHSWFSLLFLTCSKLFWPHGVITEQYNSSLLWYIHWPSKHGFVTNSQVFIKKKTLLHKSWPLTSSLSHLFFILNVKKIQQTSAPGWTPTPNLWVNRQTH